VFGLSRLLGIMLMPRMRNWGDVSFYRPDKSMRYQHIDQLFTREIDWHLITTHWQDMMQVVLSIQAGLVLPSMLLRKLGSHNRKSRLYQAFRELGRVERTLFLLRYIANRPRANRHSCFEAWYGRKLSSFRSETEGGVSLHRGLATPKWAICAISFWDVADFVPECVEKPSWCSHHLGLFFCSATKSGSRPARKMNVDWP
jgi:hypothetical protein